MRPDVKTLLAMPVVQSRMHLLPAADDESPWAGEDMRSHLIATIKVPSSFGAGAGRAPGLVLPVRRTHPAYSYL